MRELRAGRVLRLVRRRRGLTQTEVARRAGVSQQAVSLIERGNADDATLRLIKQVAAPLGITVDLVFKWNGPELDRLIDSRHARVVTALIARLGPEWEVVVEYSFNHYGDRGSVDVVAWQASTRALAIFEVKSELVGLESVLRPLDVKARVVPIVVARERGWKAVSVGLVLVLPMRTCAYDQHCMDEVYKLQAEVLKTLSNPRRLEIIHLLADGPREVGRLAEEMGISQPNVSQHLALMRSGGRRRGGARRPRGPLPAQRPGDHLRLRNHARRPRPPARPHLRRPPPNPRRSRCRSCRRRRPNSPHQLPKLAEAAHGRNISIVLFSGTDDKLQAAAVLVAGAAALGKPVKISPAVLGARGVPGRTDQGRSRSGAGGRRRRARPPWTPPPKAGGATGPTRCAWPRSSARSTSRPARLDGCSQAQGVGSRLPGGRRRGCGGLLHQRRRGPDHLHLGPATGRT
jgi:transcriptional regulator with XRE-family HTH domain